MIATNGGSAALFAYLVCAVLVAWPLFTYELIFGQYISKCNVDAWPAVHPRWKGLGFAQFMLLFIIQTYMQVVIAYTLPYIKASCIEPLPYSDEVHGKTLNSYLHLFIIVVLSQWFVLNPSSNVLSLYRREEILGNICSWKTPGSIVY